MPHLFLRWLRPGWRVPGRGAEDAGIVLPAAAVALELMRVPAKGISFAEIPDDAALLGIVDDRKDLLRRLAEPIERGPQIIPWQQERNVVRGEVPHGPAANRVFAGDRLGRVDDAAQGTPVVDD